MLTADEQQQIEHDSDLKAFQLLAAQKAADDAVVQRAAVLITADRIADARKLYQDRWKELAQLRAKVSQDDVLGADEKRNVDQALQAAQASVGAMISRLR